ncbi:hypothetical protein BDA99DRAFT_539899 [Phascolomyces articulosus]|uniref:F-box domain-containing protein n=1 Tax=Phascolomyces articulosus TaxID=60185 RepID=A0AAD5PBT1_9FUNG|nr:hypothetical protein BDA99DRAFT_539899 [Phascolomyces articulosus]
MLLQSLPHEIIDIIIRYFSFNDRWIFSRVCRDWRSFMLNHQVMWEQLSTEDYCDDIYKNNSQRCSLIQGVSPYKKYIKKSFVKHIKLTVENGTHVSAIVDFLVNLKCSSITQADICVLVMQESSFLRLTTFCGQTLTSLSLVFRGYDHGNEQYFIPPAPDMVLRECPNLKALYYIGSIHNIRQWKPSFKKPTGFKFKCLRTLVLIIPNSNGRFEIKEILEATPNIEQLELDMKSIQSNASAFVETLRQFCPKLAILFLYVCYPYVNQIPMVAHAKKRCEQLLSQNNAVIMTNIHSNNNALLRSTAGLKTLILKDFYDDYYISTTRQLLPLLADQYHKTLRVLHVESTLLLRNSGQKLASLMFPSLQHVTLKANYGFFEGNDDTDDETEVADASTSPSSLPATETLHGLSQFISPHSTPNMSYLNLSGLKDKIELTPLTLYSTASLTSDKSISNHTTARLQELCIKSCDGIDPRQLEFFFKNKNTVDDLKERSSLKEEGQQRSQFVKLILGNLPNVSPEILSSIASIHELKHLELEYCHNVTIEDIDQFLLDNLISSRSTSPIVAGQEVNGVFIMPKIRVYIVYNDIYDPLFPKKDMVEQVLSKINLVAKEWELALVNIEGRVLASCRYNHITYRRRKVAKG